MKRKAVIEGAVSANGIVEGTDFQMVTRDEDGVIIETVDIRTSLGTKLEVSDIISRAEKVQGEVGSELDYEGAGTTGIWKLGINHQDRLWIDSEEISTNIGIRTPGISHTFNLVRSTILFY